MVTNNFKHYDEQFGKILQFVGKKQLLEWSRENYVKTVKKSKIQELKKNENKKTWFSFLASQVDLELSEGDVIEIEKDIDSIFQGIDGRGKTNFGIEFKMSLIDLEITHQEIKQSLSISIEGTKFKLFSS